MEKDELDELRTKKERSLTVDAFVGPKQIDPIYFDGRMYYLVPATSAASEPYALLATAMARDNRWGVGQVVFSGKKQLAVVSQAEFAFLQKPFTPVSLAQKVRDVLDAH